MKLNFKFYPFKSNTPIDAGEGKVSSSNNKKSNIQNIIILHGLFGSSKNWVSISKELSGICDVYSLDLRNHGDSPHSTDHSIMSMAEDLAEFITEHKLENVAILGHSMGGLVSMYFDLTHPGLLDSIIIQDISPRNYPFVYSNEIESMSKDLSDCKSRNDVDALMKDLVPDPFIRQFLQMNLERSESGKYYWKLNVKVIGEARKLFLDVFSTLPPSNSRSLFVIGKESEYITDSDYQLIRNTYPKADLAFIEGGGHYIHYTHMTEFLKIVRNFLVFE